MTLLQLRYFLTLSQNLHYTKSAEQLHISQPSLSYAITELEKELGVELFTRQNRKITLNENGQLFLRYVKNALSVLDEGTKMLHIMNGMYEDRIRLGYFYSLSSPFIPDLISRYYQDQQNTHVIFDFVQEQNAPLINALKSGDLDIAFCLSADPELDSIPAIVQKMNLLVPQSHPLAQRESVRFEDFCDEPMILLTRKSQARGMIENIYRQRGKIPHIIIEAVECNATLQFVSLGRGISILPILPALEASPVRSIPIDDSAFSREVYLSWSRDRKLSSGAQMFLEYLKKYFSSPG